MADDDHVDMGLFFPAIEDIVRDCWLDGNDAWYAGANTPHSHDMVFFRCRIKWSYEVRFRQRLGTVCYNGN